MEFVSSLNAGSGDLVHSLAVRLMQHLVVPTFVLDAERRVTIWNHACERLTGIPAAEMVGTSDHWRAFYNEPRHCLADFVVLEEFDQLDDLYAAHTSPGEFGHGMRAENWCVMPIKGERRYLAVDAGPIFDDQGKLIAVVETLRDMTDQKRAEMALQNLAARDSLTSLANRRSLDEKLQIEWKCGLRAGTSLAFILGFSIVFVALGASASAIGHRTTIRATTSKKNGKNDFNRFAFMVKAEDVPLYKAVDSGPSVTPYSRWQRE